MSLEAIEKISQVEGTNRERKAAAEAEAKQIIANAERDGLALLQQVRAAANDQGKQLLSQAEERAEKRSAQIAQAAQNELILQILSALSDSIDRFISDLRRRITVTPESRERLQLAHEAIVQGLRLRDRKLLTRALEDHFRIVDENITNQ